MIHQALATPPEAPDCAARMRFVLSLRRAGVIDRAVLEALEALPRETFAPAGFRALAQWGDYDLPLDGGAAMTRPSVVGLVLAALELRPGVRVLEIGAGSGYQTAALARLGAQVVALERVGRLVDQARATLNALGIAAAVVHHRDATHPLSMDTMFDRIIVNAAFEAAPLRLLAHLAPGGVLVAPIAGPDGQRLARFARTGPAGLLAEDLGASRFAPVEAGLA